MAMVPISYNLRSLFARKSSTLLTIASIAATVAVLSAMLCLQQGFATMFAERGRTDMAVFLRPGATSEGESDFPRRLTEILVKETPEIAVDSSGQPLASAEVFLAVRRFKLDGGETNVPIRGVQPETFAIHGEDIRIVEGQRFQPGADELIVGRGIVDRIRNCHVGDVLRLNTTPFRVVGVFDGKGGMNSEVWGDADRLMQALERRNFNRVIAQLQPDTDVTAMAARLEADQRVPANVMTERDYLVSQTKALSGLFIGLGSFLALVMGIAAVFTGANAMFSQIAARTREIGILQSVGFRPFAVFVSFLLEAGMIGLLGGVLGCAMILPLNGMETGTMNAQTFSEVVFAFRFTPLALGVAIVFAIALGVVGGAIPAWRAAQMPPTVALRRR